MNPDHIIAIQGVVTIIAVVALAGYAQVQYSRAKDAENWIDEIIEALQEIDEVQGDRTLHRIVAQRSTVRRDRRDPR